MTKQSLALSLALVTLVGACGGDDEATTAPPAAAPTASTQLGVVEGSLSASGTMKQFLGIPYAAPPVGALRWKAPQAPAAWTGTRAAKSFGPHCPQRDTSPMSAYGAAGGQEDCLYLNVFTPASPGPHPVLVWIHGGAFNTGGTATYFDPSPLVSKGVIVVNIAYRLGAMGFLGHPALASRCNKPGTILSPP